ncbi:hypothetical protein AAFC00_000450 [Neodothiora populina]|uniref:Transcription initiation factor TFIID subunit 2 n=1 Tax=Neodothiora populina TaxID=2781224 RepID=A0ABR3PDD1_9PEZI
MSSGYFDGALPPPETTTDLGFTVVQQRVNFNVDFASRSISGSTEITIQPSYKDLKEIRLNCRQARITEARIEGKTAALNYVDPYERLRVRPNSTIYQYQDLRNRIEPYVKLPPESELVLTIPSRVHIQELQNDPAALARISLVRQDSDNGQGGAETPQTSHAQDLAKFAPLKVFLEFSVTDFRDGIHFVGFEDGDGRYPHLYTMNSIIPGSTSSIFPCVDDLNMRCMWDISVRCPKTLGDAFRKHTTQDKDQDVVMAANEQVEGVRDEYLINLTEEERALDIIVIASADLTDDIIDPQDPTMRTVSFLQTTPVCARHIGFGVGPFEHVDLSEFREMDSDDKIGQNAIHVHGYCLPGRADDLRNTCMPMAKAIDNFTLDYGSFPFTNYKMLFVDDLVQDVAHTASLSICSNRLLFPDDVIEPLDSNTRILIHALASQYIGVNIIPREPTDLWVITGVAGFMSDWFMKKLAGNNEYRFRQKLASEKVFELDHERYSIYQLGGVLDIDPSEYDFLALKAPLVLFILDRRLAKASGSAGMLRIISRLILNEKTGDLENGEISTDFFQKLCEKLGHQKLDPFFRQWVLGAGCPMFRVSQKFNKKKLVVDMRIYQIQSERKTKPKLETTNFMREIKEQVSEAWAPGVQPVFTGSMTIRIHEADGTPYEHIVEIKEAYTQIEIPYNTKYKRLKRSKRAKERALAKTDTTDGAGEAENDVLLYCLGDVLQSEDDVQEWRLVDWPKEEEDRMGEESYEWIRMDADFEWIMKMQLDMPDYMYSSQLQQDRDVVAQYESLQHIATKIPTPLMSTIFIRTLMDSRYFHGIRTLAAAGLARCALAHLNWVGLYHLEKAFQEFFCIPGSSMPRANDFSDRTSYIIQCAIPKAMSRIRDPRGRAPVSVRRFFVEKLKFNDNSNNEFSDCFYVATLMSCLADTLVASEVPRDSIRTADGYEDDDILEEIQANKSIKQEALNELERYRRIDEWIASYQNVYSVTALNCMQKLQMVGAIPNQLKQIMLYTQAGNADDVRLTAFSSMVNLGIFAKKPNTLKYLLFSISDDLSPYFRDRLTRVFGRALGSIAIKGDEPGKPAPKPAADSGLELEQEIPMDVEPQEVVSKSPPELALEALKTALQDNDVFKHALWQVIQSPLFTLAEVVGFLDIAALLYEPSTALMVKLRYPRHRKLVSRYAREDVMPGRKSLVLVMKETEMYRTTPVHGLGLEAWQLIQQHHLKWTGPLSKAVRDHQREAKQHDKDHKAQIAALKMQIQQQSQALPKSNTAMSPPALPTPSSGGPKISLKRKQSTVSETSIRASSPKRQAFSPPAPAPAPAPPPVVAPKPPRSPTITKTKNGRNSIIARLKIGPGRPSKIVKLKIAHPDRLRSILSKKPRPTLKVSTGDGGGSSSITKRPFVATPKSTPTSTTIKMTTPLPASTASAIAAMPKSTTASTTPVPPASSGSDFFSSPAVQSAASGNQNFGGFRFYGGGSTASAARIKTEDEPASGISPMTSSWTSAAKKEKHGGGGGGGGGSVSGGAASGGVPSRSATPKITFSRSGTPAGGTGNGAYRSGTPKSFSGGGGGNNSAANSRAGTPISAIGGGSSSSSSSVAGMKKSAAPTSSGFGDKGASKTSTSGPSGARPSVAGSAAGVTGGATASSPAEPTERKKFKLKLGKKPGP